MRLFLSNLMASCSSGCCRAMYDAQVFDRSMRTHGLRVTTKSPRAAKSAALRLGSYKRPMHVLKAFSARKHLRLVSLCGVLVSLLLHTDKS